MIKIINIYVEVNYSILNICFKVLRVAIVCFFELFLVCFHLIVQSRDSFVYFIYFSFIYLFEKQNFTFTPFCNNIKMDTMIRERESKPFLFFDWDHLRSKTLKKVVDHLRSTLGHLRSAVLYRISSAIAVHPTRLALPMLGRVFVETPQA